MSETNILFPIPHGGRTADDMGLPAKVKTEHDVEFTHNQTRYTTDADTFRGGKMIKYKLTTQGMATHNGHTWVVGEKQTITIAGEELCTEQVLHYYDSPELAVLFNPIHANIIYPRLWQVECDQVAHDGLKGAKWMVLERELPPK